MKIGFDAKRAFNNNTGLGNYSRFVISGMLKHYPEHQYYLFTPSIAAEYKHLFEAFPNVHIITPGNKGKLYSALWRTFGLTGIINKLGLDVYHGLSNELPSGIRNFSGKKIVTIHDLIFMRYPHYYGAFDRSIYKRKFARACRDADVVVAASRQTAADVVQFTGTAESRIRVVYQNCDPQFAGRMEAEDKEAVRKKYRLPAVYAVCIGTIEPRKNQLTVLKAFHKANTELHLVFVGRKTPYATQLESYINQHNLEHHVSFIENASFADFPAFYQMAAYAVYASEFEGFGIPVLEAMRSGVKVMVADSSSLKEVGGDAVFYFDPHKPEALSRLMLDYKALETDNGAVNRQLQLFDTATLMKQLMDLYHP